LLAALSALWKRGRNEARLAALDTLQLRWLHYDFELWGRDDQLAPETAQGGGAWTTWLMLGGRGAGKTRAGAEWVRSLAVARRDA
jgi:phage terminase large subunit-like protein